MTILRTTTSRVRMLAVLALAAAVLSACSPTVAPTPEPTAAFANEQEAFAAAEEVYRAYNDAGNARRSNEPKPNPQDYLIGSALEGDIDALNQLRDAEIHLEGNVEFASMRLVEANLTSSPQQLIAFVCLDLTNTRVINSAGSDVTPPERALTIAQRVSLVVTGGTLAISSEESAEASEC